MKKITLIIIILIISAILIICNYPFKSHNIKNQFLNLKGYNNLYLDRYTKYKSLNIDLDNQTIINRVNIGLDYPFYNNIVEVTEDKNITLVNKYYKLPSSYEPKDLVVINKKFNPQSLKLRQEAATMFEQMALAASKENMNLIIASAYRSYLYQKYIYENYQKNHFEDVDTYSARSGHSEHQTGLAIDIRTKEYNYDDFSKSKEFSWMQTNAYKYGYILRYPKGLENIHGYIYEPWHYRYVGKDIATKLHNNYKNLTYDEYYFQEIK